MKRKNIERQVRDFLSQFISNAEIDPDENLFASGVVSSLFAMQLVLFVEKAFGIQVANEDLDLENFKSINAITAFVESKAVSAVEEGL